MNRFESFLLGPEMPILGDLWGRREFDPWPIGTVVALTGDGCADKRKTWGVGSRQSFRSAGGPLSLIECPWVNYSPTTPGRDRWAADLSLSHADKPARGTHPTD